jgi:hypothetical protein
MVRVRYIALSLCGLLISGGGPAEAQGGWGRGPSLDNNGPFHPIPQGYHQIPRTDIQGSRTYRQFPDQGSQAYRQPINPGSVRAPRGVRRRSIPGAGNPYSSSSPRQDQFQVPGGLGNPYSSAAANSGGPRVMAPMAPSYAAAPQFQYSCTINTDQPDAGGACVKNSSARIYSGDRCRCGRQYGTID